jgi:hypothetical protein
MAEKTQDAPIVPAESTLQKLLDHVGPVGKIGFGCFLVFVVWVSVAVLLKDGATARYATLKDFHYTLSRAGLAVAGVMAGVAVYIGLYKHGDVTRWFRAIAYTTVAFMMTQGFIGGAMYLMDGRPGEDVHLIYGYGVVLSLPFFIFVEVTAKKRPAMGSYIWGFVMLSAIVVRCISTGPVG